MASVSSDDLEAVARQTRWAYQAADARAWRLWKDYTAAREESDLLNIIAIKAEKAAADALLEGRLP